jgi:uncharacterized protein YceH (UPF0502 family)
MIDELELTVETLIELDEPEAMLATLTRVARLRKGARWAKLAEALSQAEDRYAQLLGQRGPSDAAPKDEADKSEKSE